MSDNDREEIFRSTNLGLQNTLQNQLAAHRNLNQRAVDLVKIDLLTASVIVSGVSLSGHPSVYPYLAASIVGFLYSIWVSVRVFQPRHFSRGLGTDTDSTNISIVDIQNDANDGMPPDVHHEQLLMTYRDAVAKNSDEYLCEANLFENAVWASVAGFLFAVVAATAGLYSFPVGLALVAYVVIPVVCLWGKDRYDRSTNK